MTIFIFKGQHISSFDIVSVFVPGPESFLFIPESAVVPAAIKPNGNKSILANSRITFFNNVNIFYSNGPRSLPSKWSWLYYFK